jgi:GMP synthase (glutamine-hydrolysing)
MTHDTIAILDFGSQTSQLIARRLRELGVYCELFPWDTPAEKANSVQLKGFVLSGGPASIYAQGAPQIPAYVFESKLPILGICYGMQALSHALAGRVAPAPEQEFGLAQVVTRIPNLVLPPGKYDVWMSHGDRIDALPPGFETLAESPNSPIAAIGDLQRGYFGVQFHPEVQHTPQGADMLRGFVLDICQAQAAWTPASIIDESVQDIRAKVGDQRVLSAVSGGVDSSVATALVHRAVGDQLDAIFVDNGLLRKGEPERVVSTFREHLGVRLHPVNAIEEFMGALQGVTEPETKRRIIGERFIRIFEKHASQLAAPKFLVQGTIYPDVVESAAPDRSKAHTIKTHHNVGGLPEHMQFELIEPLRYLFKDEVRAVGEALGLPAELIWRQPFPGPGLAVRCLGEVTWERLERLRAADAIFTEALAARGLLHISKTAQSFAVLLPVQSVGVMGDQRTYQEAIALRAVTTEDFMTADWARLPDDLLAQVANRIVNEVDGINRVVYDITSKPPATIEWE